jgi:type IV/VI secretion system ImpK/VasF family protein
MIISSLFGNLIKVKVVMAFAHSTSCLTQRLINPVVSAAAPLLDIALAPVRIQSLKEAEHYRRFLIRGVKKFESHLKHNDYRDLTIFVCRYLICAFMDEMLLLQPWAKTYFWQDKSFSWQFAHKKLANTDFFAILEKALKMVALNLDILELGYVCLSLGFQGKYRYLENGQKELTIFTDKIYDTIRKRRKEYSRQLFIAMPTINKRRWLLKLPSKRIMFVSAIILLLGIAGAYYYRLLPLNRSIAQSMQALQVNIKGLE